MSEKEDADFAVWASEQQRQMAEKLAEEQTRAFDRIRARFAMFLPILTTLVVASCAGIFSGAVYAPSCVVLLIGYSFTVTCCGMGIYTNYGFTPASPSPEYFELIAKSVEGTANPKAETNFLVAAHMDTMLVKRGKALCRDRFWLQGVFCGMLITPAAAFLLGVVATLIKEFS